MSEKLQNSEYKNKYYRTVQLLFWAVVVFATLYPLLILFFEPHSFWYDELYSLAGAHESYKNYILKWSLNDVHPPVYNNVLWIWVRIFGFSHFSVRSLSFFFYLASIITVISWLNKKSNPLFALSFFTLCFAPLIVYYSLEVRSYSLLFFISVVIVTLLKNGPTIKLYFFLILLAWVHFYGLVLSGSVLIVFCILSLYQKKYKAFFVNVFVSLLCLCWYIFLILKTDLLNHTNGSFWIKTSFKEAIGVMFNMVRLPLFYTSSIFISVVFLTILFSINFFFNFKTFRKYFHYFKSYPGVFTPFFALMIGVSGILLLNLKIPIIVERYTLVFYPFCALIISVAFGLYLREIKKVSFIYMIFLLPYFFNVYTKVSLRLTNFENVEKMWDYVNSKYKDQTLFIYKTTGITRITDENFYKTAIIYPSLQKMKFVSKIKLENEISKMINSNSMIVFFHSGFPSGFLSYLKLNNINYSINSEFGEWGLLHVVTIK